MSTESISKFLDKFGFDSSKQENVTYNYDPKPSYEHYVLFHKAKLKRADRIPTYLEDNYSNAEKRCIEAAKAFGNSAFAFTTDYHTRDNSLSEIPMLKSLKSKNLINKVFCGGDFVYAFGPKELLLADIAISMEAASNIAQTVPFYIIRGNHDFTIKFSRDKDAQGYTMPYDKTCRIIMSYQPDDIIAPKDRMYYYTDSANDKIRYIVVDTMTKEQADEDTPWGVYYGFDSDQKDWLVNDALNLPDNEWTAVVFGHVPCVEAIPSYSASLDALAEILKDFKNKRSGKYADFTDAKGELAAYICGHNHKDRHCVEDNTLFISSGSSAYYSDDGYARIFGDESELLFDVFFINTKNRKIKAVRFGIGDDRVFDY